MNTTIDLAVTERLHRIAEASTRPITRPSVAVQDQEASAVPRLDLGDAEGAAVISERDQVPVSGRLWFGLLYAGGAPTELRLVCEPDRFPDSVVDQLGTSVAGSLHEWTLS